MAETQWTEDELRLIERLGRAPQPELNPTQVEVIKMSILQNLPTVPMPPPAPAPVTPWLFALGGGAVGIIVTVVVVVITIILPGGNNQVVPPVEQTLTAVATYLPSATVTFTPTVTPTPATATVTPSSSATASPITSTPTGSATVTATALTGTPGTPIATGTPNGTPTVTGTPGGQVIVIEGPVTNININIITIYNFTIVINPGDPILTTIRIGDIIRVEGNLGSQNGQIIIVAVTIINITIINIPPGVTPGPGEREWTDDGSCANPPPPWAPAHGWRRRCEGGGGNGNGNGNGNGRGGGDDDDDDDDDD
jgi:hypothetical protein